MINHGLFSFARKLSRRPFLSPLLWVCEYRNSSGNFYIFVDHFNFSVRLAASGQNSESKNNYVSLTAESWTVFWIKGSYTIWRSCTIKLFVAINFLLPHETLSLIWNCCNARYVYFFLQSHILGEEIQSIRTKNQTVPVN